MPNPKNEIKKREPKTPEMQLADIAEKKRLLAEKEKRLNAKLKSDERKNRDKRHTEIGKAVEDILKIKIEKETLPIFIKFISPYKQNLFSALTATTENEGNGGGGKSD